MQELASSQRIAEMNSNRLKTSREEQQLSLDAAKDQLRRLEKMNTAEVKKLTKMTKSTALKETKRTVDNKQVCS